MKNTYRAINAPGSDKNVESAASTANAGEAAIVRVQGMMIDPASARNAIILSEIIGPPLAKRKSRKWY